MGEYKISPHSTFSLVSIMEAKKEEKCQKERRDLYLEFKLNQWIEGMIQEKKPADTSFEEWLSDGKILARLMRTISFNSLEDDSWMDHVSFGCLEDVKKERIRNLISQIREYGVDESLLFHETDLLHMSDIPRVSKCLKEVAIIAQQETSGPAHRVFI